MRYTILFSLFAVSCLASEALAASSIGYRGGVHRTLSLSGPLPPTTCDTKSNTNIRWKVPLPNWGYGHPIIVDGKVYLTCEGGHVAGQDFPNLMCFDLKTGAVLWDKQLNHLDATGHSQVAQEWSDKLQHFRDLYVPFDQWMQGDAAEKKKAEARWGELGYKFGGYKKGYGALRSLKWTGDRKSNKQRNKLSDDCKAAGLALETWQQSLGMGLACFGQSFPTPVSDGSAIYVATAFSTYFKFSLDGKLEWVTHDPSKGGEYCRNGRSPLVHGDLFISDVRGKVRGIDKATGKLLWSHEVPAETWMSPAVITVDDKDILLTFNRKAFLLPSGKPLTIEGGTDFGALTVVNPDKPNISFHTGGGEHGGWTKKGNCPTPPPSAIEWSLSGDTLQGKILWNGIDGKMQRSHTGLTYHKGKLYHAYGVLDPNTGKALPGGAIGDKKKGSFKSQHVLWAIDDRLYSMVKHSPKKGTNGPAGAKLMCYGLDGKRLGESFIPKAETSAERERIIMEQTGYRSWKFSYSYPLTIGEGSIVIRSNDELWCIASK